MSPDLSVGLFVGLQVGFAFEILFTASDGIIGGISVELFKCCPEVKSSSVGLLVFWALAGLSAVVSKEIGVDARVSTGLAAASGLSAGLSIFGPETRV